MGRLTAAARWALSLAAFLLSSEARSDQWTADARDGRTILQSNAVNDWQVDTTTRNSQINVTIAAGKSGRLVSVFQDTASQLVNASHRLGLATSSNKGISWIDQGTLPPLPLGDAAWPILAANTASGRIFLAFIDFAISVSVLRSNDGGVTWAGPASANPGLANAEFPWIAVDNFPGAGKGNVYVCWYAAGQIRLTTSTDGGVNFNPPTGVKVGDGKLCHVSVSPNHQVNVFFLDVSLLPSKLKFARSTNRGSSFKPAVDVYTFQNDDSNVAVTMSSGTNTYTLPQAAVNPDPAKPYIYAVFHDDPTPNNTLDDNGNILMVRSTDNGKTWSPAQTVDGDNKDQFMPSIAMATPGRMMVGYYSRSQSTTNTLTHLGGRMGVIKPNGTVKFYPRFQLGPNTGIPSAVDPEIGNTDFQIGYFNQFAASAGNYLVAWADSRFAPEGGTRQPDVHFARIAAKQPKMDLQVSASFLQPTIVENKEAQFRIRLKAVGGKANDAFASLPSIPAGTEIRNVYGGDCTWSGSRAACSLGTIAAGSTKDMFVTLRAISDGSFPLTAMGSTTSLDTRASNNSAAATLVATPEPPIQEASYSTGNLAINIPDLGQAFVPLNIPDSGTVRSVEVAMRINHSFVSDLKIELANPTLTARTVLMVQEGGGGDNVGTGGNDCSGAKTVFRDSAASSINGVSAPFNGSFRPDEELSEQANGQLKGNWFLIVRDQANGDTGTIGCFEMTVKYQ